MIDAKKIKEKSSRSLIYILLIGFFIRILISIWNGFWGPSFGAELDALNFHLRAVEYSQDFILEGFQVGWIYSYILGAIYLLTMDSLFLGSLLSSIAWLLSGVFFLRTLRLLSLNKRDQKLALLIYVILPSSILYTSVTLREAYQLLFVNIAIYSSLMIIIRKSSLHWLLLAVGIVFAGILHGALMAFGALLVAITLFFLTIRNKRKIPWLKLILVTPVILIFFIFSMSVFTENSYQLEDGLAKSIEKYQTGGLETDARANYKTDVSISSNFDLVTFIPVSLFHYLFEPMPWKISSVVDVYLLLENILRLWLIWMIIKGLRTVPPERYRSMLFVFICYLTLETIWSLGTINWGTALRHHIPSMGMLLASAFFSFTITKNQLSNRKINYYQQGKRMNKPSKSVTHA